jgi:hypothetical protein
MFSVLFAFFFLPLSVSLGVAVLVLTGSLQHGVADSVSPFVPAASAAA